MLLAVLSFAFAIPSAVLNANNEYIGPIPADVYLPFWELDQKRLIDGKSFYCAAQETPNQWESTYWRPYVQLTEAMAGHYDPQYHCSMLLRWWWYLFYEEECLTRDQPDLRVRELVLRDREHLVVTPKQGFQAVQFYCAMPLTSNGLRFNPPIVHRRTDVWRHCRLSQIEDALLGRHTFICPRGWVVVNHRCVREGSVAPVVQEAVKVEPKVDLITICLEAFGISRVAG